jgi:hypothetical protein
MSPSAKLIKAMHQNILWTSSRHEGTLVHSITVYIDLARPINPASSQIDQRIKRICFVKSVMKSLQTKQLESIPCH